MIALPQNARLEHDIALGVALWDISESLVRNWKLRRDREGTIKRIFTHHTGSLGAGGWKGPYNSSRYVVEQRKDARFPGPAYTFWFPYEDVRDPQGRMIVYRCNRDEELSYHTGGLNHESVSVVWQGQLNDQLPHYKEPSPYQLELAEAFYPWVVQHYGFTKKDQVSFHSEAGEFGGRAKAICPGRGVEAIVTEFRNDFFEDWNLP